MPKVMLIEDDPTMLSLLQTLLEMEGHQVVRAEEFDNMMESIRTAEPDLILLDVFLEDQNGLDLVEGIRQDAELKTLRVIMSSGMDYRQKCLEKGADDFVMKPYMPDELVDKINKLIAR